MPVRRILSLLMFVALSWIIFVLVSVQPSAAQPLNVLVPNSAAQNVQHRIYMPDVVWHSGRKLVRHRQSGAATAAEKENKPCRIPVICATRRSAKPEGDG